MSPKTPPLTPTEPFAGWPVHITIGETDGLVWFTPPNVMCIQFTTSRCDLGTAKRYVAAVRTIRAIEHEGLRSAGGLRLYQDCRSFRVFDREARMYLSDAARMDFTPGSLVFNKIALPLSNPIVRVAVQLIARTARSFGLPSFELESDLGRELVRANVRPLEEGPRLHALIGEYTRRMSESEAA